jgi:hypothetical protein
MAKKNPRLNQIIAVVQGKKSKAEKLLTEAHHRWNDKALAGISRTYEPLAEDGESLPSEFNKLQTNVREVIAQLWPEIEDYMDVVATQEMGNTTAKADVMVDEIVVLPNAPIGVLLFLEKRLEDLATFIGNIPVLSPDRDWSFDNERNCFVTPPTKTVRTKKTPKTHVKYEATKEHPAQCEMYHEDVVVGHWTVVNFSGALDAKTKAEWANRCRHLLEGVKKAREEANSAEVIPQTLGKPVLEFIFGKV